MDQDVVRISNITFIDLINFGCVKFDEFVFVRCLVHLQKIRDYETE